MTLARTRDPRAAPFLRKVIEGDPSAELRYLARKGMQYLQQGGQSGPSRRPPLQATVSERNPALLTQNLESADPMVRLKAIRIVQLDRTEGMSVQLAQRLEVEDDVGVLATLLEALGGLGDPEVVPQLVPWLKSSETRLRANAIEALGNTGSELALAYLIPHLRDPDNRCRGNAVLALRKSGRVNVHRTLETMLRSPEVSMQDSATFCLGRMGQGQEVFRLLTVAMESRFTVTRNQSRAVLRRLEERGSQRAESILRRFGSEDEPEAMEDLLDKVEIPVEQAKEVYLTAEEKAEGVLERLRSIPPEVLQGSEIPEPDRPERLLQALQTLAPKAEAEASKAKIPRAEEVLDRLQGLSGEEASKGRSVILQERESRSEGVLSRLRQLQTLGGDYQDRNEIKQAQLLNALRALS